MIEQAGVSTAVLSWVPDLSVAVGAPRVVGVAHPGSVPFGEPGDAERQREVLRRALEAAARMQEPGQRLDLDFEWPEKARVPRPPKPPPIARAIMKRPWLYMRLLKGDIPGA